jgi:hypothetical protein
LLSPRQARHQTLYLRCINDTFCAKNRQITPVAL